MHRYLGCLAVFLCLFSFSNAQVKGVLKEERSLLYRNEAFGSISLHSGGWGIGFRRGKHITGDKKRMFDFDLVGMKHPKEIKLSSNGFGSSYVFGKANSFLILRTGYGYQSVLYNKAERGGVEIRYLYYGGISWGFTKPVYFEIADARNGIVTTKFVDSLNQGNINGSASFFKGFDELGFHPGVYGKLGLTFEYGNKDTDVKAIEAGIVVDAFPKPVPIMALIENKRVFLSFYISFLYGKKW